MKLVERVLELANRKDITMYILSQETGISQAALSRLKSGHTKKINRKSCKLLSEYFNVSPDWLLTGNEEALKEYEHRTIPTVSLREDVANIPLVTRYSYTSYRDGCADSRYLENLPHIPFIVDREGNGNYIAFEVRGDSMDNGSCDSYVDGDRLYCREMQKHLWSSYKLHQRQWDFVIVHKEGILVKRIIDHDVENNKITIQSLNPEFPDREIDLAQVKQMFYVIESARPRKR